MLLALQSSILSELLNLDDELLALAGPYYRYRAATIPAILLLRVCTGVLSGLQCLRAATALNVGNALLEGSATAAVLFCPGLVADSSSGFLPGVGMASLLTSCTAATVGLVTILVLAPPGVVVFFPPCYKTRSTLRKDEVGGTAASSEKPLLDLPTSDDFSDDGNAEQEAMPPPFRPWAFIRDSRDMMARSLALQASVWALGIFAARLGSDALAGQHVALLLWMLTSYIIDGFADLGTMYGSKMLGAGEFAQFARLVKRLVVMALITGATCGVFIYVFEDWLICLFIHTPTDATVRQLHDLWPLLSIMQLTNSAVFVYDGLLSAATQFAFVRSVLLVGVGLIYGPALAVFWIAVDWRTLLALWTAKALLNTWRCMTSIWRIHWHLPQAWALQRGERKEENECTIHG
jgi:Na+-driven multidrug efflux pump